MGDLLNRVRKSAAIGFREYRMEIDFASRANGVL